MTVTLRGNSPAALTAGILLLSRARSFGQRIGVEIVGDPADLTPVLGPALVTSAVLTSCGVGREFGSGATVIVPGPSSDPLAVSLAEAGDGPWFFVDRSGAGGHPCTQAFVRMCRDPDLEVRELARRLRRALGTLGCAPEPAVFDLLFEAPVPPLVRTALALRAGRALSGTAGGALSRYLVQSTGTGDLPDGLEEPWTHASVLEARESGKLDAVQGRLGVVWHDPVEEWLSDAAALRSRDPAYAELAAQLVGLTSHVCALPPQGMLPPLHANSDAVAVGLANALGATQGPPDANRTLAETFRFLGGRFVGSAAHAIEVEGTEAPSDRLGRWQWFCASTRRAASAADSLWRRVVDPVQ